MKTEMASMKAADSGGSNALALAISVSVALVCTASIVAIVVYRMMAARSPLKVSRRKRRRRRRYFFA